MSQPVITVAILTPKQGMQDQLVQVLERMIKKVQDSEHGCLTYQLHTEIDNTSGSGDVVMIEKYSSQEAFQGHSKTPHMGELIRAFGEEFVLNGPPIIKNVGLKSGFTR